MPTETVQQLITGWTDMLVYITIALVTIAGLGKCIYPVLRNGSLLNRAVLRLEKNLAKGELQIWRDARFLGRSLRGDWQRFLLNAGQLDARGMPCNTDEYINEDSVVYKPGHAQLAELIPSLLTSLGILGTFMGMMEGLTNLDFNNAEGVMASIPTLLEGMRFAFATSIAGITCSLAFNVLNRIVVGRAFKALDTFEEAFYELVMPRPLDPDVQMICQKQDAEENVRRAAEGVASHAASALELALSRAMHPFTVSMDHFMKGATQEQIDGIQAVVRQFMTQMNVSLEGQLNALGETMHKVNQGQMAAQENVKHTLELAEKLASDAQRIQAASHGMAEQMQALRKEADAMQAERDTRDAEAAQQLSAAGVALYSGMEALTESLARMKRSVDEITERAAVESARGVLPLEPDGEIRAGVEG